MSSPAPKADTVPAAIITLYIPTTWGELADGLGSVCAVHGADATDVDEY